MSEFTYHVSRFTYYGNSRVKIFLENNTLFLNLRG